MATKPIEVGTELLERAQRVAEKRGVAVPQLVQEALEHELGEMAPETRDPRSSDEGEQPPVTCIAAFSSGRGDLSKLASEDVFEPASSR